MRKFCPIFILLYATLLLSLPSQAEKETLFEQSNKYTAKTSLSDLDAITKRRVLRFLVPYSKTFFFLDGATPRGLIYERAMAFEAMLNQHINEREKQIHIILIPTPREKLFENLLAGKGDIAAGNLTITPTREKKARFSKPFLTDVEELLVSNKNSPPIPSIFALSGKKVYVRKSSSYYESLTRQNHYLASYNFAPITIIPIAEQLEDEDILELINAGNINYTVVDQHKADFWAKILPNIKVNHKVALHRGGEIAWALRPNNPELLKKVNQFVVKNRAGTYTGNILFRKYLQQTRYISNALHKSSQKTFQKLLPIFKKYGKKYNFDYFLLIALAYQESKLNQHARSERGAIGIMQILPTTARSPAINVKNIMTSDGNIHAGTKYLRYIADRYFPKSTEMNQLNRAFFIFAAYNAGPNRINGLRKKAASAGYNPNIWFKNVEVIASQEIGRETVEYVSNIFKYYIAYSMLANHQVEKSKIPWLAPNFLHHEQAIIQHEAGQEPLLSSL